MNHPTRNLSKGADQNRRNRWGWIWRCLLLNIILLLGACQVSNTPAPLPGSLLATATPKPIMPTANPSTTPIARPTQGQHTLGSIQVTVTPTLAQSSYCEDLTKSYQPPDGIQTYCDPDFLFAFDYPAGWKIDLYIASPDTEASSPLWIRKGQMFSTPDLSNYIRVDTYHLYENTSLSERVKNYFSYPQREFANKDYPSLTIGGHSAYVIINRWVQDISAVTLFFQSGPYYTAIELKAPSLSSLAANWNIARSLQVPGFAPSQNSFPEDLIADSHQLVQPPPPSSLTPTAPALSAITTFPTSPGTTWVYLKKGYTQADGEPQKIIHGTSKIVETIVDEKEVPPYLLVHIKGNKTMVSADDGWQENGPFGLGDYEYWYLFKDNLIYYSFTKPDTAQIKMDALRLDFQFPLVKGSEWCITTLRLGSVEHPTPDPNSPCESRRLVANFGPYQSSVGVLKSCYEVHDLANSGDLITEYCEGIGIAAVKYDHGGSQFGSSQELISFTPGKANPPP